MICLGNFGKFSLFKETKKKKKKKWIEMTEKIIIAWVV